MKTGVVIAIEGIDGSGKTTLADALAKDLQNTYGIDCSSYWLPSLSFYEKETRQFIGFQSGAQESRDVSDLVWSSIDLKERPWLIRMLGALKLDLVWRFSIGPKIARGSVVICDRNFLTLYVRARLEGETKENATQIAGAFPRPDLLFYLDGSPEAAMQRAIKRAREDRKDNVIMEGQPFGLTETSVLKRSVKAQMYYREALELPNLENRSIALDLALSKDEIFEKAKDRVRNLLIERKLLFQ